MHHQDYLAHLERHLHGLPDEEKEEVLSDYREHFELGMLEGRHEEDIAKELGHPRDIAKEVFVEHHVEAAETNKSFKSLTHVLLSTTSLSLLNLIIVLGPAVAVFSIYISLWAVAISLYIGALGIFFVMDTSGMEPFFLELFSSFMLLGLAIMLTVTVIKLGSILYHLFIRYAKWNINMVKGDKAA
ncbi:hypothetical protein ACFFGV_18490 [Pontibacillus salicampi]|uniref:DUF1700 domain-containing protein n=1 Tax=Pontibacillus salicampi TaxID=1449801 RepID=A0ABV6LT33_9BACI